MRLTARRLRSSRLALGGLRETGDPRRTGASYSTGLPVRSPENQGRPGPSTSGIIDRVLRRRRSGLAAGCGRPSVRRRRGRETRAELRDARLTLMVAAGTLSDNAPRFLDSIAEQAGRLAEE